MRLFKEITRYYKIRLKKWQVSNRKLWRSLRLLRKKLISWRKRNLEKQKNFRKLKKRLRLLSKIIRGCRIKLMKWNNCMRNRYRILKNRKRKIKRWLRRTNIWRLLTCSLRKIWGSLNYRKKNWKHKSQI